MKTFLGTCKEYLILSEISYMMLPVVGSDKFNCCVSQPVNYVAAGKYIGA